MQSHKYADLFPMMDEEEFANLVEDIRANGLLDPIVVYGEEVLDGRNRLRACEAAGVEPQFTEFEGDDAAALQFVISHNLSRRHLTASQRAAIAADATDIYEAIAAAAEERRRATVGRPSTDEEIDGNISINLPGARDTRTARHQMGSLFGVNGKYVGNAVSLLKNEGEAGRALVDEVKAGNISMAEAWKRRPSAPKPAIKKSDPLPLMNAFGQAEKRVRELTSLIGQVPASRLDFVDPANGRTTRDFYRGRVDRLREAIDALEEALG